VPRAPSAARALCRAFRRPRRLPAQPPLALARALPPAARAATRCRSHAAAALRRATSRRKSNFARRRVGRAARASRACASFLAHFFTFSLATAPPPQLDVLRQESLSRHLTVPTDLPDDSLVDVADEWLVRPSRTQHTHAQTTLSRALAQTLCA
jgi:hypothetical protein